MRIGAVYPQTELGSDPANLKAFALAVEELGFSHLAIFDHVLGADTAGREPWKGPYTHQSLFHEVFVAFGYLAGLTSRIGLATSVLVLPQRQTPLVAKQAAEVDVLSGGRMRLGVGLGWNDVEYAGMGEDFTTRGARVEEQAALLRALWTQEVVDFQGRWHTLNRVGINPLPVQRPIPVWFGGGEHPRAVERIARIADGWFPPMGFYKPDASGRESLDRFRGLVAENGRDPASVGIEVRSKLAEGVDASLRATAFWAEAGASASAIGTMGMGLRTVEEHIEQMVRFRDAAKGVLDVEP